MATEARNDDGILERWRGWFFQSLMIAGSVITSAALASFLTYVVASAGQGRVIVARLDAMGADLHWHKSTLERHVSSIERMQADISNLSIHLKTLQEHKVAMDIRIVEILTKMATFEERSRSMEKPPSR